MTRNEAKGRLEWVLSTCKNKETSYATALKVAIESLTEHDGCVNCHYEDLREDEYPCNICKESHESKWKMRKEDEPKHSEEYQNGYSKGYDDGLAVGRKEARTDAVSNIIKPNTTTFVYDYMTGKERTTEPSDLISRADAVKEFIKLFGCIQDVSDIDEWTDICKTTVCEVPSAEPTAEEEWSVAQKVFHSTLTYREAVDYVKEVEKQHERFNQQSGCDRGDVR